MIHLLAVEGGRGSWWPEGTAGKVAAVTLFFALVVLFGWGAWRQRRRRK